MKSARERAGLTQAKLAEDAGITDETVSRLERGAYEPSLATILAIAHALGTTVEALTEVSSSASGARRVKFRPSTSENWPLTRAAS